MRNAPEGALAETAGQVVIASIPHTHVNSLDAATWLAERGMHVFELDHPELPKCAGVRTREHEPDSCTERGKHPCGKWSEAATTEPQTVTAMFTGNPRNIGIACGPSGLVVIDEDVPGDFARYCLSVGEALPVTFTVRTAKGAHYYFTRPDGVKLTNQEGALRQYGVNVRGIGGYVVGPGSLHQTGVMYEPVDPDAAILPCPAWLVAALAGTAKPDRPGQDEFWTQHSKDHSWWRDAEVIHHPDRHSALVAAAGYYLAVGLTREQAVPPIRDVWRRCCPGTCCRDEHGKPVKAYTWEQAAAKLDDIYGRYEAGDAPPAPLEQDQGDTFRRLLDGAAFVLDAPDEVPCIWGRGDEVIWSEGESLMIAAPPGVGKTTVAGQIVRARLAGGTVLGYPVEPTGSKVLYLAMDRPAQIARSLRRHFRDAERAMLTDRLIVWKGPPPGDLAKHPATLTGLAEIAGADTLILDSLKDAALGLTEDETGAAYNRARQAALVAGVQLIELHHLVKRGPNGARPTSLADVYGSAWLTAGAGSVVLLWGAGGDPIVEWHHLKQPAEEVGPFRIIHDHTAGISDVWHGTDLLALASSQDGLTGPAAAAAMFGTDKPSPAEKEKARRKLDSLVRGGHLAVRDEPRPGGGRAEKVYYNPLSVANSNHATNHGGVGEEDQPRSLEATTLDGIAAGHATTLATTATTRQPNHARPPLYKGDEVEPVGHPGHKDGVGVGTCHVCGQPMTLIHEDQTTHPMCEEDR